MIPHRREGEGPGSSQVDPFTGLVVATCFWEDCDNPAPIVMTLPLRPRGSRVIREVQVPLCTEHRRVATDTGRVRLFTHPDNLLGA